VPPAGKTGTGRGGGRPGAVSRLGDPRVSAGAKGRTV